MPPIPGVVITFVLTRTDEICASERKARKDFLGMATEEFDKHPDAYFVPEVKNVDIWVVICPWALFVLAVGIVRRKIVEVSFFVETLCFRTRFSSSLQDGRDFLPRSTDVPCTMIELAQIIGIRGVDRIVDATWWAWEVWMQYDFLNARRGTGGDVPDLES